MKGINKKSSWMLSSIPSQRGRLIIVTGTGGIGYETALALTQTGAEVILEGRNSCKGEATLKKNQSNIALANIHFGELDLADFSSIKAFAKRRNSKYKN